MISFDFEYYKPTSIDEAIQLYKSLDDKGKNPRYFSGGTEIITLGRVNKLITGAVIDLKGIPDCLVLKKEEDKVTIGSSQTLTNIRETAFFPFLNKAIVEIADHTARNKITLGGNICANIIYRETILPLLLTESEVIIATSQGLKRCPLSEVFDEQLNLEQGEFVVQIITEVSETNLPFLSVKKRRQWDVGYPLLTTAALKKNETIKFAFSGLCSYPFRSIEMEDTLNNQQLSIESRIDKAIQLIPAPVLNDVHGSAAYRLFVLRNTLEDVFAALEGVEDV